MDRIIRITLALFVTLLVGTLAFAGYTGYVTNAYEKTRTGTYSYTLSITTDHPLKNATLFIPVPADRQGNSPAVAQFSARAMPGVPTEWQTTLFDTGKATLLKIQIPLIDPPAGTSSSNPYTITINADMPSGGVIDTTNPVANSPVFGPIQDLRNVPCVGYGKGTGGNPECSTFTTTLYADYSADPETTVTITSSITGKNSWLVFEPAFNEYSTVISLMMHGEHHGWAAVKGTMANRIGSYDSPFHIP
jgi:hypothetical protein